MKAIGLVALLALSGCAQTSARPADSTVAIAPDAQPPRTLQGNWDVRLLDGSKHRDPIRFSADVGRIYMMPDCAGQSFSYRISGNRIALTRETNHAACAIGLPPRSDEFMAALAAANTVQSVAAGAIRLHGGGLVLLLVPRVDS